MVSKLFIFARFEALRIEKGVTKSYIARALDRTPTIVQDWKQGKSSPDDEQLAIVARILQTTPEYLRGETDDPEIKTPAAHGDGRIAEFENAVNLLFADNPEKLSTLLDALANEPEKTKAKFDLFLATL